MIQGANGNDGARDTLSGDSPRASFVWRSMRLSLPGITALPFATLGLGQKRVLIIAPSHGGKSTLIAFALIPGALPDRAGPLLIDDNETWLDPRSHAIARGRPLMVRRPTVELLAGRLPDLARFESYPRSPGGLIGHPTRRAEFLSCHRIDAIVFLSRSRREPRLHPVDPDHARVQAAQVLKQRLGRLPSARQVRCLHRLIARSRGAIVRLEFDTPEEGVALLGDLHERLVSG